MHIKEIIIDGFKSYSVKTTISHFDRHFNAITGLNGSGKSNILDAICFVLGITTLSNVRASNLQELIYKYGNAGVNKASVTITFDNSEKKYSPIGCEDYEDIIVTRTIYQGKSKYFLNGYTATQDNIKSLFQSVQLNINNPHFLIMQGKVTQVVNMKPLDILGLMEEAAGTSIYEMKKESALKTIKKKENKLEEINKLLAEEISPQLEKLMKDKQNYLTWKSRENEIERIVKWLTAHEYHTMRLSTNSMSEEIVQYKRQEEECTVKLNSLVQEIEGISISIDKIDEKFRGPHMHRIKELENKYKEILGKLKTYKRNREIIDKNIKINQAEITKYEMNIEKLCSTIERLEKEKKNKNSNLELQEKELENKENFLKELERNLENVISGKHKGDDELYNLNKLITETKINIQKSKTEKNNLTQQIRILNGDMKTKENELAEFKQTVKENSKQSHSLAKQISQLTDEINMIEANYNPKSNESIKRLISENEAELSKLEQRQNEILYKSASRIEIQFRDPEHNFDRSKVKGRIIRSFNVDNERYATALEQVAGGKLFNIIVDTEATSQLLLSRKCFDYGVILIPLNKIRSFSISNEKMRMVHEIAGDQAHLAIDLIKYDKQFHPAMQFVFGTTFVCNTSEVARKLAYNDNIRVKCVNLDGDVFDPSGTMTGGAKFKHESVLLKVQQLNYVQEKVRYIKGVINENKNHLQKSNESFNRLNEIKLKLENSKALENDMSEENINKNLKRLENEIGRIFDEIKHNEERIKHLNGLEKKYIDEMGKYEADLNEFRASGSKSKDIYAKKIKGMKLTVGDIEKSINRGKKEINDIEYQISQRHQEIEQLKENIINETENTESNKKDKSDLETKLQNDTDLSKRLQTELDEKKREITKNETELNNLKNEKDLKDKKREEFIIDLKKIESTIHKYDKEIKENDDLIRKIEKENKWIETERSWFGLKDTDYDFSQIDNKHERLKLSKLQEENALLRRKVNMKVDIMADQYEKEYNSLVDKREIIIKDKTNIEKAIVELDDKRKDALDDIYSKVNKNLDSIYSSLLPGTKAKLDTLPGKKLMDGLELRVAFNNKWKSSLSELSGGQRSLLALSLILALLLYKPAPVYILDEIDAALDLSHTANLGLMIREHFPQSQFVVVSLKDGMFNNANVLYKVSFYDGTSKVDRISKDVKDAKDGKEKMTK